MSEIHAAGVGAVLGDAGGPVAFDWSGKTYTLDHPTQKAKEALEVLVLEQAEDDYQRFLSLGPKFANRAADLDAQIFGRQWATWGKLWVSYSSGPDGAPLFLLSLLRAAHPELTLSDARLLWNAQPRGLRLALARVLPDFFTRLVACRPGATPEVAQKCAADFLEQMGTPPPDAPQPEPDPTAGTPTG